MLVHTNRERRCGASVRPSVRPSVCWSIFQTNRQTDRSLSCFTSRCRSIGQRSSAGWKPSDMPDGRTSSRWRTFEPIPTVTKVFWRSENVRISSLRMPLKLPPPPPPPLKKKASRQLAASQLVWWLFWLQLETVHVLPTLQLTEWAALWSMFFFYHYYFKK